VSARRKHSFIFCCASLGVKMKTDFFGGLAPSTDESGVYASRRKELIESIKTEYSHSSDGIVVLFATFEQGSERFR